MCSIDLAFMHPHVMNNTAPPMEEGSMQHNCTSSGGAIMAVGAHTYTFVHVHTSGALKQPPTHPPTMARRKCTMTGPLCDTLLKAHVATIDDQVYASEDQELLVKHYLGFLAGTAPFLGIPAALRSSHVPTLGLSSQGTPSVTLPGRPGSDS